MGAYRQGTCNWRTQDPTRVFPVHLELVHHPGHNVKENVNHHAVCVCAFALGGNPTIDWCGEARIALQGKAPVFIDCLGCNRFQLMSQLVTPWEIGFEESFQELQLASNERTKGAIHLSVSPKLKWENWVVRSNCEPYIRHQVYPGNQSDPINLKMSEKLLRDLCVVRQPLLNRLFYESLYFSL